MANSTIPNLAAVTVPALTDLFGVRQSGDSRDKKLTVTQLLTLVPSGGDVSKVGTPVNNELGVWTGDGTLEGDTNLQWDAARLTIGASGLILPAGSAAGPSQVFTGSLGTGWYTPVANVISASIAGVQKWSFQADKFNSAGDGGTLNFTATDVIPGCIPRGTDLNTGIGGNGADTLTAIAGGLAGQFWNETNAGVLSGYASSPTVTAFATGGQGGATVLINSYNIVTTVATTGDSVRLQATHDLGSVVYCKNEGANSLDIFPASGDDLGAGLNTAVAIPVGEFKCFITTVAQSTWTELLPFVGGGGDVTKVGTPVLGQLGVWTGDGTIEGVTQLSFGSNTFVVNLSGGDLRLTGKLELQGSNRPAVLDESSSNTNPTFAPLGNSPTSGLGGQGSSVSLIAFSKPAIEVTSLNALILQAYQTSRTITAFATGGQTNAVILGSSFNILTTVATTGDSVKLPILFQGNDPCTVIYIKNDGANAADVFPGLGDDLGAGLNTAVSVAAGESVSFIATVGSSTWTPFIVDTKGGGGAQISGTPANNQLGVWVNATDIEGDTSWQVVGSALQGVLGSGPEMRNVAGVNIHPRKGDTDTGIASRGDNRLAMVAQGVDGIKLIGAATAILQQHNTIVGLTAFAGGGSASATQLNASYSVVSTVATTGDSVKLSTTLEVGVVNYVKNDGANAMDLFPAAGDDLGLGVGVAISVGAGKSVAFIGTVTGSTSTQFIFEEVGDVTKVGTPANNQIGVWTGDGTIEGDANFLLTGTQLILPSGSSAGLPELKVGPGETGLFSGSATQLRITVNGTERFTVTNDIIQGFLAGSGQLHNRVSSATVPTFTPNTNDGNTGIGGNGSDALSLIAGGLEGITIANAAAVITNTIRGNLVANAAGGPALFNEAATFNNPSVLPNKTDDDTGIGYGGSDVLDLIAGASNRVRLTSGDSVFRGDWNANTSSGPALLDEGASSTNPTIVPNQADDDTGIGRDAVDSLAFIAGGVSCMRVREIAAAPAVGFYTTTPIVQQTGVAVTDVAIHAALVALGLITA